MKSTKFFGLRWLSFLLLTLMLGGCVYLRLLEVKHQLAEFDRNFRVQVTDGHFILHFLHPVLFDEDFIALTKLNPSRTAPLDKGQQWFLDFSQIDVGEKAEQVDGKIVFRMTFSEDHRLTSWDFSPLFLEMAPPAFLEASIKSLGKGKVLESQRQLRVDSEDLPKVSAEPPSRKAILAVLGTPARQFKKGELTVYQYRFQAEATPVDSSHADRRIAEAKLYFDPVTNRLTKMSSRFAGLKISVDYRKLTGTAEPGKGKV
jgi:hypothetical protein